MADVETDRGTVRAYDSFKGFGFIRREKGRDVFFSYDDILDQDSGLMVGDVVSFELTKAPKGPRAVKLVKLD